MVNDAVERRSQSKRKALRKSSKEVDMAQGEVVPQPQQGGNASQHLPTKNPHRQFTPECVSEKKLCLLLFSSTNNKLSALFR